MIHFNERRVYTDIHKDLLSDFIIDLDSASLLLGNLRR